MRQQFSDLAIALSRQVGQYVFQIDIWIMPIELGTLDQTHHCHIVETGNESWRFKNSSAQVASPSKSNKPKSLKGDAREQANNVDLSTSE